LGFRGGLIRQGVSIRASMRAWRERAPLSVRHVLASVRASEQPGKVASFDGKPRW